METRRASGGDASSIREVGTAIWPSAYAFAGPGFVARGIAERRSSEAIASMLATTVTLVALHEGRIIGMGNIDLRTEPPVVWRLYVMPAGQRSGVGATLLERLVEEVPLGSRAVRLSAVEGDDGALAFSRRHGFRTIGRKPGDEPGDPGEIVLERVLVG